MNKNSEQDFLLAMETTGEVKEIWNSCQFDESSSLCFNESITLEFIGDLNREALEKSLIQLLERHGSLRASFSSDGRQMRIKNHQELSLDHVEYSDLQAVADEEQKQCLTLFDLEKGPLIRFVLLTPKENNPESKSYLIM